MQNCLSVKKKEKKLKSVFTNLKFKINVFANVDLISFEAKIEFSKALSNKIRHQKLKHSIKSDDSFVAFSFE